MSNLSEAAEGFNALIPKRPMTLVEAAKRAAPLPPGTIERMMKESQEEGERLHEMFSGLTVHTFHPV